MADNIKTVENERIRLAIVATNNHFAGFGSGTVNVFRNKLGLTEAKWQEQEQQQHDLKQRTLSDFMSSR